MQPPVRLNDGSEHHIGGDFCVGVESLVHVQQFCRDVPATIPHIASECCAFGNRNRVLLSI